MHTPHGAAPSQFSDDEINRSHEVIPADSAASSAKTPAEEQIPDDLLQAFRDNYRKEMRKRISVILVVSLIIGLSVRWRLMPDKHEVAAENPAAPTAVIPPVGQKPPGKKDTGTAASLALPSFIPAEGHDPSYAVKNPGWENYVSRQLSFRVYRRDGKLKALQVIGTNSNVIIPESLVKKVLAELAGSASYRIRSRENKSGFLLLRGVVSNRANVLFYREGSKLRAFVVTLS